MNFKLLLTVLLVCSVLIPSMISESVRSQMITTATNVQYFTSSSATTVYSTSNVTVTTVKSIRYDQTPFDFDYQTGIFTLGQTDTRPSASGVDVSCLYYEYFLLNGTTRQEIRGHFELTMKERSINFFILTQDQFRSFKGPNCAYGWNGRSELHVYATSYNLDWVVPQDGEYALLFLSPIFYGGYVHFTAQAYSTTVQNQTVTFTTTETYTVQSSQVMVSTLQTMNVPPTTTNYYLIALIVILIGLIAIVTALVVKSRMKPS